LATNANDMKYGKESLRMADALHKPPVSSGPADLEWRVAAYMGQE